MLQKSLLFVHPADEEKNYNEALELSSGKFPPLFDFATVSTTCITISILGLLGNGIILWLLCCTIKTTKFTVYAANMAAADIILLLCTFSTFLETLAPPFSNARSKHIMIVMFFFGHGINSYFIAAMSTERCLTVFSPGWYQTHRPECSTTLVCASLWSLAVTQNMLNHFICSPAYIFGFKTGMFPCMATALFLYIVSAIKVLGGMVVPILALLIRMKKTPHPDIPARLDVSIWITVALHIIFYPGMEMIHVILTFSQSNYHIEFFSLSLIFYCMNSSMCPFVYLLVGCWKWKRGQEPFYMFLERALKDKRQDTMGTQPDQEQA